MNGEKMPKKPSLGSIARKRLSDITNSQQRPNSPNQDEKPIPISSTAKDYIEQLQKENIALMRLLAERSKIIELTGVELTKIRINLQKVQQQNWHLAQANSQTLAELNIGKDRLKAMQHELGCKVALLTAKNLELQEKVKIKPCQKTLTKEGTENCEEVKGEAIQANGDNKICNPNRRRDSRIQLLGPSTVAQQVAVKKADDKSFCLQRQSARSKSEQLELTEEKADNKRPCLRRQSARFISERPEPTEEKADQKRPFLRRQSAWFKPEQLEPTEDLFEMDNAKFPVRSLLDEPMQEDDPSPLDTLTKKEEREKNIALRCETSQLQRSSIGRPMRRAAEKVQSYKEVPINVKMRRAE